MLHNHLDIEDILQTTWYKIMLNYDKIKIQPKRKIVNFMITVLKNSTLDLLQKNKNNKNTYYLDEVETSSNTLEKKLELNFTMEVLQKLNVKYKTPLILKVIHAIK